jgi:hypothetical protein
VRVAATATAAPAPARAARDGHTPRPGTTGRGCRSAATGPIGVGIAPGRSTAPTRRPAACVAREAPASPETRAANGVRCGLGLGRTTASSALVLWRLLAEREPGASAGACEITSPAETLVVLEEPGCRPSAAVAVDAAPALPVPVGTVVDSLASTAAAGLETPRTGVAAPPVRRVTRYRSALGARHGRSLPVELEAPTLDRSFALASRGTSTIAVGTGVVLATPGSGAAAWLGAGPCAGAALAAGSTATRGSGAEEAGAGSIGEDTVSDCAGPGPVSTAEGGGAASRAGNRSSGSTYPFGSVATRTPRWT